MDIAEIFGEIDLFQGLSRYEIDSVVQVCQERSYRRGELIFSGGSTGDELYIVKNGRVAIQMGGRGHSPAALIHVVEPNQVFGEMALIDQENRAASAKAMIDCEVLILYREDLNRVFDENPHIGHVVMQNLASVVSLNLRKTNLQLMASQSWK
ncbi:cyclic nucleotide-binding domain-containing protein [Chloroflexota bacterium]